MAATDVSWFLTDHACRICFGRLLERMDEHGRRVVRCANCGTQARNDDAGWRVVSLGGRAESRVGAAPGEVRVRDLCCCGLRTSTGRPAGLRCARADRPSPEQPAEISVKFTGLTDG